MGKQQPTSASSSSTPPPATTPATPPAGTPAQKAAEQKPASEKPVSSGYNFAAYYLNTPGFDEDSQRHLANLYQTSRFAAQPVYMPKEQDIRSKLRERYPDAKPGDIDMQVANMRREYERFEHGRFNKVRTTWQGLPDTPLNAMKGLVTTKTDLDERPSDPYAKAAGMKPRRVAKEFDMTPEKVLAENFGRAKEEENEEAQYGGFERVQHETQLAKERTKQNGFAVVGVYNEQTGQVEAQRDKDGRPILAEGPVDPTKYGYQATMGDDKLPILMRVPKKDLVKFRGELANVQDILPKNEEETVARAIHSAKFGFVGAAVRGLGMLPGQVARYDIESTTGNSISRSAYNFGGYTANSIANSIGFIGGKFNKEFEQQQKLDVASGNKAMGALNADVRQGAFSNMPSFLNSMSQLSAQLTTQTAFNLVAPGAGLAVTALDATQNGYYEGMKNGLSETESNWLGVGMGAMAFGLAKALTGQAASKMAKLIYNGQQNEVNAIVRAEVGGLAKLVAGRAKEVGRQLTKEEIEAVATQAKPWLVEKIGGRMSALYDKAASSGAGSWALGAGEEFLDEAADNLFEDATRQGVRTYLEGNEDGRPDWVKQSLKDGSNAFAYKSVGDIFDGAIEGGALGFIGGGMTTGPMAGSLASAHRAQMADQKRLQDMGATEAFASYLVQNDFSKDSITRLQKTLDTWKAKGNLGMFLDENGQVTEDESKTQNAVMHRSLTEKLTSLSELAKQANLLQFARGEGKSKVAEELSRALGRDENYLRTQQGMTQLLGVIQAQQDVAAAVQGATDAIQRDTKPATATADPGNAPALTEAAPDANGDGQTSPALGEGAGLFDAAPEGEAGGDKPKPKKDKEKKGGQNEAGVGTPDPYGPETPLLARGRKQLEALAPQLGAAGNLVVKWSENQKEQTATQVALLKANGEDVETRTALRQQLAKLQQDQEKIDDDLTIAAAQTPAIGSLKKLAEAQLGLEKAAVGQQQLFDGTLLSYQLQEGMLRLQQGYLQRQVDNPGATAQNQAYLQRGLDAMTTMATNPATGIVDAAWIRTQLVDNEEYVARRRFAPLSQQEAGRVQQATTGAAALAGVEQALRTGDEAGIESALSALEKAAPGQEPISVLDEAQTPQAQALLDRTGKLDQRGGDQQASPTLDPAQVPVNTQAPATPESRGKRAEASTTDKQQQSTQAPTPPSAEQVANEQAQQADEIAEQNDQVQGELDAAQVDMAVPATEEMLADLAPLTRTQQVFQGIVQSLLRFDSHIRGTWTPEMEAVYDNTLGALFDAHYAAQDVWKSQMEWARATKNKQKAADLKARDKAEGINQGMKLTDDLIDGLENEAVRVATTAQAERFVRKFSTQRGILGTALTTLKTAMTNLSRVLRQRGGDLKKLAQAKAAITGQQTRYGVRSLANVGSHVLYEQLLPILRPVAGAGRASLSALRSRLGQLQARMAEDGQPEITPVKDGAKAAGIGGVTAQKGNDTNQQVARVRQLLTEYRKKETSRITAEDTRRGELLGSAFDQLDEQGLRENLEYFGRSVEDATSVQSLLDKAAEVLQEIDEETIASPGLGKLQGRINKLMKRLVDPVDLLDVRGSDPDTQSELEYLTGMAGVPGQLVASIKHYKALSEGTAPSTEVGDTPEKQQAAFAAINETALLKLRQAAEQNLGLALYRMRIVPLLIAPGALPSKSLTGMGLKELDGAVAGQAVLLNQLLLQQAEELLNTHRQLGVNRYRDDDKEQQLVLAHRQQVLSAMLELPSLAGDDPELVEARRITRVGLEALVTAGQTGTANLAHLDAAEGPLRQLLRLRPALPLALLEDMLAGPIADGRAREETLSLLMATKDGGEVSPALALMELLGPSRAELAALRLQRLSQSRGGQSPQQPTATTTPQLSLEQEYVLQSALSFLTVDNNPLRQLIAKYPNDFTIDEAFTGLNVPAVSSTMVISGKPGTGKTFISQEILAGAAQVLGYSEGKPLPVILSAPKPSQRTRLGDMAKNAGKAVVSTMMAPADLLKQLTSGQGLAGRLIVMDEGTALSVEQGKQLVSEIEKYNTGKAASEQVRLLLLGDPLQLPGVSEQSGSRSDAGHPFISQEMAMYRSRPLRQSYRSGYVTLHTGQQTLATRILSGISDTNPLANDLSPVEGVRYAQPGGIDTIEGWTYLDEATQHTQIVHLAQALARHNPENKAIRVLVAPGKEKQEIAKLQNAGLTENQAAGIVFAATDPRDQVILNYDDAQGGEFHFVFVATGGEPLPANGLRATYVGASRAQQYASVRLLPGQQPVSHKETGSLAKYSKLEGEPVKLRNEEVIAQLTAAAKTAPQPSADDATTQTPGAGDSESTATGDADQNVDGTPDVSATAETGEGSSLVVNADGELAESEDAEQAGAVATSTQAAQTDEEAIAALATTEAPAGTIPDSDPETTARMEAVREEAEQLRERVTVMRQEVEPTAEQELTEAQETRQGLLQDPLSDYYATHMDRVQAMAQDLAVLAENPDLALADGATAVAELQAQAQQMQQQVTGMRARQKQAIAEAMSIPQGFGVGKLPALEALAGQQQPGIVLEIKEDENGRPRPVGGVAYIPDVNYETGQVTGITAWQMPAVSMAGDALAAVREMRKFVQGEEQRLSDIYYHLGSDVATTAARRGRLIVHSYALPVPAGADAPPLIAQQAKNGWLRQLFDTLRIGTREEPNPQTFTRDMLKGIASEQGMPFDGDGNFMLRFEPNFQHNYLRSGESPEREKLSVENRFIVEYSEGSGTRTLTLGAVRFDGGATKGRVRPVDGSKPDTALDDLLNFVADTYGKNPRGIDLGHQVEMEGWRNGRLYNPKKYQLPYSESYSVADLRTRLAAEGKSASSPFTVTTPSNRDGVKLSSSYSLTAGNAKGNALAGRQVLFVSHGNRTQSEVDGLVEKAMRELPAYVTGGSRTDLTSLNDRQLSAVLQAMLERYDLQLVPLGAVNLNLGHYATGLRSVMGVDGVQTFGRPNSPETLDELLSTTGDAYGVVSPRYTNGEVHPKLPWDMQFRNALMGSLFGAEQARATTRNGKTKKSATENLDPDRPGLLNTVRYALFESGVVLEPVNGGITLSPAASVHLSPTQQQHLRALVAYHQRFWPGKDSSRVSAGYLQDLLLYLDYLQGKGLPVEEAWQKWEGQHAENAVQFNGYVLKADREKGKAPLFARTTLPPGLTAEQMFTTRYSASAEPNFQLNLSGKAQELMGGVKAAQPQVAPTPVAPKVVSSPEKVGSSPENVTSSPENVDSSPQNVDNSGENVDSSPEKVDSSPQPTEVVDEFAELPGQGLDEELTDTNVVQSLAVSPTTASETPAAPAAPAAAAAAAAAAPKSGRGRAAGGAGLLGGSDPLSGGSYLTAGSVANPEPELAPAVLRDLNWILGEDFPREIRDLITGPDGLPADYSRVLGRFFRGVIELNRLPGGELSRAAGRHEPLHAIMWLLKPEQQQRVYAAARRRIADKQGASVAGRLTDGQVEEYLAGEFQGNWDTWAAEGEAYRNKPLVKVLSRTAYGRDLLQFWQGLRNVFNRITQRKDAVDRLFESAHRGYFVRGREELLRLQGQSQDPARYATRERTMRREGYEMLRKRLGAGVLLETEQKIGNILYGSYLYNYLPGEAPLSVGEALQMMKGELKDIIGDQLAGSPQGDPAYIAEAAGHIGTLQFLNYPEGTRLAATVDYLMNKADESVAPGLRWLDVLLRQQYAFAEMGSSNAYAQVEQEAESVNTTDEGNVTEADSMNLSGDDAAVMGKGVDIHQRDSNLVDKERESLESDRLLRQLETVPLLQYRNGKWVKQGNLRTVQSVPMLRHVLHRAYGLAKQRAVGAYPTRLDVAMVLQQMAEPGAGSFGEGAASLLHRYFNQNGILQAHDSLGNPISEPSFHEIAQSNDAQWSRFMDDALSELHGFFSTVEPRSMLDEDADKLIDGVLDGALKNPVTGTASRRKNLAKSVMFLKTFTQQGNEYVPNPQVLRNLKQAGFVVRLDTSGKVPVVSVEHESLPGMPVLRITRIQQSGAVRGKWQHGGSFGLPQGDSAYWQKVAPLAQKLVTELGIGSVIDTELVRNITAEHQSQDKRDFTDPLNARTLLGQLLAQSLGQTLTAHLTHGRRSDGTSSNAALDALVGDSKLRAGLMPVLYTDLKDNTDTVNDFLDRKSQLGREVKVLSPTRYWETLLDLSSKLQQLAPEREARAVYNDRNQKKATYRNTTAVYPRWRTLQQLAKLGRDEVLPASLAHLAYLRNAAGGYLNLFASGILKLDQIRELNVLTSRRSGKRKAIVKASSQELYQHVFWGGFLNQLASNDATGVNIFNLPRSDKPTQKDFGVTGGGGRVVARVSQRADGTIIADDYTRSLVAHQQQAVRSIMTHDSYERYGQALRTLLARPSVPARTRAEQRLLTGQERTEIANLLENLTAFRKAALDASPDWTKTGVFGYPMNDLEEVQALRNLTGAYGRIAEYLNAKDGGKGYWLSSMNLDPNVDHYKGKYPERVSGLAVKPRAEYVEQELASLAAEVNDVMGAGMTYMPAKLANKAWAALTGQEVEAAGKELNEYGKKADSGFYRIRRPATAAEGTGDRYNPLMLSGLLTYRIMTGQLEQIFNGHHLYFKDHQTAVKRGMARETPIEVQDQEARRGLGRSLGVVGFEDTKLDSLHEPASLQARYSYVRKVAGLDGKPMFEYSSLPIALQDARQQTPLLLGMLDLESKGIVLAGTPEQQMAQVMQAGMAALNGTDSHDGMSFMNMLQYRAEQHGMGNKYNREQTVQKSIYTGQNAGGSILGKTATMLFTNELLDLGNEYLYNKFVASMGGPNSLPMKAWLRARTALTQQSASQPDGDKWLAQQLRDNKDWELAEEYLHTDPAFSAETTGQNWRDQLSVAALKSAIKSGPVGMAGGLDSQAHYQRVIMQLAESGRVLSLHADLDGSTIARITQEEHIPAGLGENFKTTKEVYGFLQELAREGLLNLDDLLKKTEQTASKLGLNEAEAGRAFFYKQLEQLMAGLDQRGTTLSAVQQNLDPNLTLLQQHLQTAIAQAINGAVSKLRLPGVRASVASMTGLVNMYEVTFHAANGTALQTTRMTQQELLGLKTKKGQKIAGRTAQGQLMLGNFFHGRAAGVGADGVETTPAVNPRYSVKVDELQFIHLKEMGTGKALDPVTTMKFYQRMRAAQAGDQAAITEVAGWQLGTPQARFEIEPAEILMPRAILAPFFSAEELAGLTARQVKGFDAAFFARRELKYLSYRKGLSKADVKLYDALSEQFAGDKPGFKLALRQAAAARGIEIHENLQTALTPKGTRIPVTNLNSMQLFKVAGFFDSHSNTSIVPSELLTVSGADNDGDQLSHEFFDVGQRGLSELSGGVRPATQLDEATLTQLLGTTKVAPATDGATPSTDTVDAADAPELANSDVDTADDADAVAEAAEPMVPDAETDTSVTNTDTSDTQSDTVSETGAEADANLSPVLRRTIQSIRRSLFKAKSQVLRNAANIFDMMAPIDMAEFDPFASEATRQEVVFGQQRQGVERQGLVRSGQTSGAYEMFRNLALHIANQAGKTGVGPFVKARELFDVYRLALSNGANVSFKVPFAFMGRMTTSLESHSHQAMRQLEKLANAALDNAKMGYLGLLNVNEHTWGLYSAGILGGMRFDELIPTINHQYLRNMVEYVTNHNNVREPYPTTLVKALEGELMGYARKKVEQFGPQLPEKQNRPARGWYKDVENPKQGNNLLDAVHARQMGLVQQLALLKAAGQSDEQAWLNTYGFTVENLRKGEVTRKDGTVEPVKVMETFIGREEENVARYIVEQGYLLAKRGGQMREQIGLLTVLSGIPTNDFDSLKQARNAAKALGLDSEANDLADQLMEVGKGDFRKLPLQAQDTGSLNVPTRTLLEAHPYLQTGLQGLARDMQQRESLLLRRQPVVGRLLERALRSGFGRLGLEADRYQYGRAQLERLADIAYLRNNPLVVPAAQIIRNADVATDLRMINRAAKLGQHTMAGQEMTRRAIARVLQTLKQQPESDGALGRAGSSLVVQIMDFSADGRRLQPEVRGGVELTPQQKMNLEAASEALPLLTKDYAEDGKLVQQLLLYYQLTSGGLRLGRGQLTELLPATILRTISDHRAELAKVWGEALMQVEAQEKEANNEVLRKRRAAAKAKGLAVEQAEEARQAKDAAPAPSASISEASRQSVLADLLRNHGNEQVHLLAGLLDQYALPLAKPEWLPSMNFTKLSENGELGATEQDNDLHYAKNSDELPTLRGAADVRDGVGSIWMRDEARKLPRYVQARTGGVAGYHVYAQLPMRPYTGADGQPVTEPMAPTWVRQYATAPNDAIPFGEDRPALSFLPVFDSAEVTDGTVDNPRKSTGWGEHEAKVMKVATKIANELAPRYKKLGQVPETAAEVVTRLGHFVFGGREMPLKETVICGPSA